MMIKNNIQVITINKYKFEDYIDMRFGKLVIIEIFDKMINGHNIKFAKCKCDCGNIIEKRFYDIKNGKITTCMKCDSILLIGQRFGELTVIKTFYKDHVLWCECQCSCGNIVEISASNLKRGNTKTCKKCDSKLLIGKTFGELTVIDTFYKRDSKDKIKLWCKCKCTCGNIIDVRARGLKSGQTKSCGTCNERNLIGKQFGELTVISTFYKMNSNNKNDLWCHCLCSCGKEIDVRARSLMRKESPQISCGCIKVSKGQRIIEKWLENNHIEFTKEETFNKAEGLRTDKCNYLRFDIYIPSNNLIIEFDGVQHFYPIEMWGGQEALLKTQQHDLTKNNWANENSINLIRFNYKQTKKEIESKLKSLLL